MPQCSARVSGFALSAILFCLLLPACSMSTLEKFALENAAVEESDVSSIPSAVRPDDTGILEFEAVIKGAKQPSSRSTAGVFRRLLVGNDDEIALKRPVGVGGTGNFLYIVDAEERTVFRYDLLTSEIEPLGGVGPQFVGDPGNIYVSSDLSFYVVDSIGKQVIHFDQDGGVIHRYQDLANLSRPMDVFVDERSGDVFIADGSFSHVIVFDQSGKAKGIVGQRGIGPGRFRGITAATLGPDGIYVVDRLEIPIQVITDRGVFKYSMGESLHSFPTSIAVSPDRTVFVGEKSDDTIRVYQDAKQVSVVGGRGSADGRFREIASLWFNQGKLYVADSLNRRIQVFKLNTLGSVMPVINPKI